jgi:hypothetical protein
MPVFIALPPLEVDEGFSAVLHPSDNAMIAIAKRDLSLSLFKVFMILLRTISLDWIGSI